MLAAIFFGAGLARRRTEGGEGGGGGVAFHSPDPKAKKVDSAPSADASERKKKSLPFSPFPSPAAEGGIGGRGAMWGGGGGDDTPPRSRCSDGRHTQRHLAETVGERKMRWRTKKLRSTAGGEE